jgi:putative Mg2+ transporter-C (MgtC) family protein
VEDIIKKYNLKFQRRLVNKKDGCLQAVVFVTGHKKHISKLDEKLLTMSQIKSF